SYRKLISENISLIMKSYKKNDFLANLFPLFDYWNLDFDFDCNQRFLMWKQRINLLLKKKTIKLIIDTTNILYSSYEALKNQGFLKRRSKFDMYFDIKFKNKELNEVESVGYQNQIHTMIACNLAEKDTHIFSKFDIDNNEKLSYLPNCCLSDADLDICEFIGALIAKAVIDGNAFPFRLFSYVYEFILKGKVDTKSLVIINDKYYQKKYFMNDKDETKENLFKCKNCIDIHSTSNNNESKNNFKESIVRRRYIDSRIKGLNALKNGFWKKIGCIGFPFNYRELEEMLNNEIHIDVDDWKNNTIHMKEHEIIENINDIDQFIWFWKIVYKLNQTELKSLFFYSTECSSLPIGGFSNLTADGKKNLFCIKLINTKSSCIFSQACFNQLFIPGYISESEMEKEIYEIVRIKKF
ncbi:E3 ubiquitin-protein ligase TOM1-like, partial [Astathelohania contejeani]